MLYPTTEPAWWCLQDHEIKDIYIAIGIGMHNVGLLRIIIDN